MVTRSCNQCGARIVDGDRKRLQLLTGDGDFDCAPPADFCGPACLAVFVAEEHPDQALAAVPYAHAARLERELRVNDDGCEAQLTGEQARVQARLHLQEANS